MAYHESIGDKPNVFTDTIKPKELTARTKDLPALNYTVEYENLGCFTDSSNPRTLGGHSVSSSLTRLLIALLSAVVLDTLTPVRVWQVHQSFYINSWVIG